MNFQEKFQEKTYSILSREEFLKFLELENWVNNGNYIDEICSDILRTGFIDPFSGYVKSTEVEIIGRNFRETLSARGLNARQRAIALLVREEILHRSSPITIYAPEAFTGLSSQLKRICNFVGSEYLPTAKDQVDHPDIRHEDVMNLSFPDSQFDVYYSCEVMEHIPSINDCLTEAARVLKPEGTFLATFPFAYVNEATIVKAVLVDGQIINLVEPEFHGNPIKPEAGSLVFSIPAWDIVPLALKCGFRSAEFLAITSRLYGITAAELATVLVMRCHK